MVSDLDELRKESTIEFPRSLEFKEVLKLLDYISINLPGHLSGKIERHFNFRSPKEREDTETKRGLEYGTSTFGVMIRDENNYAFDAFETCNDRDLEKISSIRFQTIPGYVLEDHNKENRKLWSDVRRQIEDYFAKNPSPHQ